MKSRLVLLRRLSFFVLVLWTAVLAGSFLNRRFRHRPPTEPVEVEATPRDAREQPVRVHKGFTYSDTLGIEPNFRISAREAVEFSNGWYEFRSVQVSLYHEGRVAYGLVSETLRLDPVRHEAETGGEAEVSLEGGVALHAGGFTLGGPERFTALAVNTSGGGTASIEIAVARHFCRARVGRCGRGSGRLARTEHARAVRGSFSDLERSDAVWRTSAHSVGSARLL